MKIITVNKCELCPFLAIIRDVYRRDKEYLCTQRRIRFIVSGNIPEWCPLEDIDG